MSISPTDSSGKIWWSGHHSGIKSIAAWLWTHKEVGEIFTLTEIRKDYLATAENLSRRLRELRELGWAFAAYRSDPTLEANQYRLLSKGWHPSQAKPQGRVSPTALQRRQVFDRDNFRCVICGISAGEEYSEKTLGFARLTVGHKVPVAHGGLTTLDNLQTECSLCNEPVRDLSLTDMRTSNAF